MDFLIIFSLNPCSFIADMSFRQPILTSVTTQNVCVLNKIHHVDDVQRCKESLVTATKTYEPLVELQLPLAAALFLVLFSLPALLSAITGREGSLLMHKYSARQWTKHHRMISHDLSKVHSSMLHHPNHDVRVQHQLFPVLPESDFKTWQFQFKHYDLVVSWRSQLHNRVKLTDQSNSTWNFTSKSLLIYIDKQMSNEGSSSVISGHCWTAECWSTDLTMIFLKFESQWITKLKWISPRTANQAKWSTVIICSYKTHVAHKQGFKIYLT